MLDLFKDCYAVLGDRKKGASLGVLLLLVKELFDLIHSCQDIQVG